MRAPSLLIRSAALRARAVFVLAGASVVACTSPAPRVRPDAAPLSHEAYVWQRGWTPAVSAAVAEAPAEVRGLRTLMMEVAVDGSEVWPAVDRAALARSGRPVTAVVRIDGRRLPAGLSIAGVRARVGEWQAAGVDVAGIEIDHDCATAALADYAVWLARERPPTLSSSVTARPLAPLRWSITALPTWAESAALRDVAAAVDELVVQVHAVQAPRVFEPTQARRWLEAFAAAVPGARLRVALPTYQVNVAGQALAAAPDEVGGFLRALERAPVRGVGGVVWFRLPVAGDDAAWSTATLLGVIRGAGPAAPVAVELVERRPGVHDIVLANHGIAAAPYPPVALDGAIAGADLIAGYRPHAGAPRTWKPPARDLAPGARTVVGWATGKDLRARVP